MTMKQGVVTLLAYRGRTQPLRPLLALLLSVRLTWIKV
jgi:hypothetical protein